MTAAVGGEPRLAIGMVAHDKLKAELVAWAKVHRAVLALMHIHATGTTGRVLGEAVPELEIERLRSGPLGGDQQMGALIAERRVDALFFFVDPLTAQPHEPDVRALVRLATLYETPLATNRATADLLISHPGLVASLRQARGRDPLAVALAR